MTEKRQVAKTQSNEVAKSEAPRTETIFVPDVDIRENADGITLLADMPGADQQSVGVTVENNVLTIEGDVHVEPPQGYELVGQEYGVGRFRRDFTLSNQIGTEGIKARVRHGVLEVTLPRREELKSRKIEIAG